MTTGTRTYATLAAGTISGAHSDSTTTLNFATGFEYPEDLATGEYALLTLGPTAALGDPERLDECEVVALVGPYTAGAASGTIERAQEGTTAIAHSGGDAWIAGAYASDMERVNGQVVAGRMRKTADQTLAAQDTFYDLTFGVADFDEGGVTDVANDYFVAPVAGVYLLSVGVGVEASTSSFRCLVKYNGTLDETDEPFLMRANLTAFGVAHGTLPIQLEAGDTVGISVIDDATTGQIIRGDASNLGIASWASLTLVSASAAAVSFTGAKVRAPGGQSLSDGVTAIMDLTGGTTVFDSHGFLDLANDRVTIPAGQGGRYLVVARFETGAIAYNNAQIALLRNGSFLCAEQSHGDGSIKGVQLSIADVIDLEPGDYIEARIQNDTTGASSTVQSNAGEDRTGIEIVRLGQAVGTVPQFKGARVSRTTTQSVAHATDTEVEFDTVEWDEGGYADLSSNPADERLTVPDGEDGWYAIRGEVRWESFATSSAQSKTAYLRVAGNASHPNGDFSVDASGASDGSVSQTVDATVYLEAGAYVRLPVRQSSNSPRNLDPTFGLIFLEMRKVGT